MFEGPRKPELTTSAHVKARGVRQGSGAAQIARAEVGGAPDEVTRVLCLEATVEVMRAKVLIGGSILEHVVDGGEDGSGDRHDCLDDAFSGAHGHECPNRRIEALAPSEAVSSASGEIAGEKSLERHYLGAR